jgi:ABC-type polysaccharide/polyol phosphate transport system ATPase subunit
MIALESASKGYRKPEGRRVVLDRLDWALPDRGRVVVLAQAGMGKSTLLQVLAGMQNLDEGWVERGGVVSAPTPGTLLRYATTARMTSAQLASRLARVYFVDHRGLIEWIESFLGHKLPATPVAQLSIQARVKLALGLFWGLPCDYYLFDNRVPIHRDWPAEQWQKFISCRLDRSGGILATSNVRLARQFGGAYFILHQGKIKALSDQDRAIGAFNSLSTGR